MPKWVWMVLVMKYGEITRTDNHTAGAIRLFVMFCKLFVRGCSTLFTERIGIFYPN
ncbi:hypothetical protein AD09_1695 [Escherichia coli 1-176-05_S4_C2]|nr:hypothetical protein PPECC33_01721 [Escherichia coli PCN033]ASI50793.1 Hypothetical protein FORC43_2484 [Escherichia coli]EIO28516.1 hypothetical protein ECPA40_2576 [Escherichia coli PA40]EKH42885.1 hypothetical protein ECNE1487_2837 [Escherichia coli NE1487]EYE00906.1 hypothetical protein AD37_1804 [Escherichia coli 1-110-08_S4_C3]EZJ25014.1 hypothetical protein AD38_1878 [Escherichia coli 1-176-05_S4_C3]EZJ71502.1 hypothetical protein AC81_1899 [Escherichia coli 1-176-05_S4_C1]KDA90196